MRRLPRFAALFAMLLCVGCGQGQPSAPPASSSVSTPAVPTSAAPSTDASPTPSAVPSASDTPTVPDAAGALDVSQTVKKAGYASFASPSGKIWCALYGSHALCHFPYDYAGKIPSSKKVCGDAELDVTGVVVHTTMVEYFCSGDPEADPRLDDSDAVDTTGWWKATGWPEVKLDGQRLATVPYGKSLVAGGYVCASAVNGVTCGNTATGRGFRIARAGVTFIG